MATIQEQYAELIKQGQDAALAALKTWSRTFQQTFGQLPIPGRVSPDQAIDQAFDFAGHVLDAQRDFAKQLVATGTAAAGKVRDSASPAAGAADQN